MIANEETGVAMHGQLDLNADVAAGVATWQATERAMQPIVREAMISCLRGKGVADAERMIDDAIADAAGASWEPIVPLDDAQDLPACPIEVLPPWLRDMVAATALAYQVPPELPGMYALALVSGALAGRYEVEVRPGWRMPITLYVLVALPPSERKTPVIRDLAAPLRAYERERALSIAERRQTGLTLVKQAQAREAAALRSLTRPARNADLDALRAVHREAAQALADAEAAVPPEARMISEYATPEALAVRMAENGGRQIVLSDEGAGVLSMTGRYSKWGGADLDLLLRGFDSLPFTPDRVTRQVRPLEAATLTIALAAQPAAIVQLLRLAPEIRERGLLSRFLTLVPNPRVGTREVCAPAVPLAVAESYALHLRALLNLARDGVDQHLAPQLLRMSRAANEVIAAFEREIEPQLSPGGRFDRIAAWAGKLAGHAARVAADLHAADHAGAVLPAEIGAGAAERAVEVARVCVPHQIALADMLAAPPETTVARRIAANLQNERTEIVTERGILRSFRTVHAQERDAALALLARHGIVRRESDAATGVGRRSKRWEVNPAWLRGGAHAAQRRDRRDETPNATASVPIVPPMGAEADDVIDL